MSFINAVIDISHHNGTALDFAKAKKAGVIGVLHKASQGLGGTDPNYALNRKKVADAGLLWGAYHFATGSEGVHQAEAFLAAADLKKGELAVLDFEPNKTGPTMGLTDARAFVTHVAAATGRFPGFYSGSLIKEQLGNRADPVLSQCWFWLAQYGPTAVVPVAWKTWTMWQYTDGGFGPEPHDVDALRPRPLPGDRGAAPPAVGRLIATPATA